MIQLFETRDTRGTKEERGMLGWGGGDKAIVFFFVCIARIGCICESENNGLHGGMG